MTDLNARLDEYERMSRPQSDAGSILELLDHHHEMLAALRAVVGILETELVVARNAAYSERDNQSDFSNDDTGYHQGYGDALNFARGELWTAINNALGGAS